VYIQDHGLKFDEALMDGMKGNRFHLTDFMTISDMKRKKRYERFVVCNGTHPNFEITGSGPRHGTVRHG